MIANIIVSGNPILKYSFDEISIPCFLATSKTIKLAIDPNTVKFPAIVENSANTCQRICSSGKI